MGYLASFDTDGWELEDGEALNREAPDTFHIPPGAERQQLCSGQIVKLVFRIALSDGSVEVERMWVVVVERRENFYIGKLDNNAYSTEEIKAGMEVYFEPRHIIQVWRDS